MVKIKDKNVINIRIDGDLKSRLLEIAEKNDLPLATFIRYVLLKYAEKEDK
jgi:antitoxin component of RelBE/YafQ-DinJ toxin-antitoxin module